MAWFWGIWTQLNKSKQHKNKLIYAKPEQTHKKRNLNRNQHANLINVHVCVCACISLYTTVVHSTEQFCLFSLLTSRQLLKLRCCVSEGKGTQQAESCSAVVDICVIAKQHCVCVIVWCCLSCTFVQHWVTLRLVLIDVLIADVLGLICCLVTAHFWILHKLSLFSEIIYLLIQSKSTIVVAKYCDEHVCLCVCLSVRIS